VGLAIEQVSAGYGRLQVLHGIDLKVPEGMICALMGRNGSGKTTLLRVVGAVLKPMQGHVKAMGKELTHLARPQIARLISLVPQSSATAFPFTCREMVLMGAAARVRSWAAPGRKETAAAMEVLSEVGIEALALRPFNQISGGERQLVMLARALFQDTPVMLLDEPNSHLDFSNQHMMMELMQRVVKRRGVTALISLHDPNLTLAYCDMVVMLRAGRVVAQGPTVDVMQERILREVLGDNIRRDTTITGLPVVTPRSLKPGTLFPGQNHTEVPACDAPTVNGDVN